MIWKERIFKGTEVAIACVLSIFIANILGLSSPSTAGIITILSLGNTKHETIIAARNRTLAFLCAMIIAVVCFNVIGFRILGFGCYIFLFVIICLVFQWQEAIAMDSVLITHFMAEGNFGKEILINEILLFIIGTGFGIIVNLIVRKKNRDFEEAAEGVDDEIKLILEKMSEYIKTENKENCNEISFNNLKDKIKIAHICAMKNYNNTLIKKSEEELKYVEMRQKQSMVLEEIYKSIVMITILPKQANDVGKFLKMVSDEYHKNNDVENLIIKLNEILFNMKSEELPKNREEFEARAILYYILRQMEKFLMLKNEFVRVYF